MGRSPALVCDSSTSFVASAHLSRANDLVSLGIIRFCMLLSRRLSYLNSTSCSSILGFGLFAMVTQRSFSGSSRQEDAAKGD